MIAKDLHLRRKKDQMEVITLENEPPPRLKGKRNDGWNEQVRQWVPVRYVKSGRKGYLKGDDLEANFVVVGRADPDKRWAVKQAATAGDSAAAMEIMRERDIVDVRKRILKAQAVAPHRYKRLEDLNPSANAIAALDQAIHMILSGG